MGAFSYAATFEASLKTVIIRGCRRSRPFLGVHCGRLGHNYSVFPHPRLGKRFARGEARRRRGARVASGPGRKDTARGRIGTRALVPTRRQPRSLGRWGTRQCRPGPAGPGSNFLAVGNCTQNIKMDRQN
jgi:hypothetical protein